MLRVRTGGRRRSAFAAALSAAIVTTGALVAVAAPAGARPAHASGHPAPAGARPAHASGPHAGAASTVVHRAPRKLANMPPNPNFTVDGACRGANNDSKSCNTNILAAITNARKVEGMKPMAFSLVGYLTLTLNERIFAATNLERIDRGLPPLEAITSQLNRLAYAAALVGADPRFSDHNMNGGASVVAWGGNYALGFTNSLASDYGWMYWDGPGSPNSDCRTSTNPACYAHRKNILGNWPGLGSCAPGQPSHIYLGVGDRTQGVTIGGRLYAPSITELFVHACGPVPGDVIATWASVKKTLGL
jgi:hypothetical protein